jgi:hypothetical protein
MTAPTLGRATFRTSRPLDFCSRKELIAQTGHREEQWPLVALKELVDNALDACEYTTITPVVLPGAGSDDRSNRAPPYEALTLASKSFGQAGMAIQVSREALGATNAPPPCPVFQEDQHE